MRISRVTIKDAPLSSSKWVENSEVRINGESWNKDDNQANNKNQKKRTL